MASEGFSCLFDTSWTLYRVPTSLRYDDKYRDLLTNKSGQDFLARNLKKFLTDGRQKHEIFDDSESDRNGGLQSVTVAGFGDKADTHESSNQGLLIKVAYERALYKAAFCRRIAEPEEGQQNERRSVFLPLLLLRMPSNLAKRLLEFLSDTFQINHELLHFSTSFLYRILDNYLSTLCASSNQQIRDDLFATMIKDVKLSYTFSPPAAPQLKTMDMSMSANSITDLLGDHSFQEQILRQQQSKGRAVIETIIGYLDRQTGLQLPHVDEGGQHDKEMIKLSKARCAAFVVSAEGKLKLISKMAESVVGEECIHLAEKANMELIEAVVGLALEGG
ncbi:MAG: hypothetical protein Q9227_003871 [Pyrenula ochraceoflavens]